MKRALKWIGRILGGLVALLVIAGFAMYMIGGSTVSWGVLSCSWEAIKERKSS